MWIADLKIVLGFCIYTSLAYKAPSSKQDYIKKIKRPLTTTESALVTSENDIYLNLKLRHPSRFLKLDEVQRKIDNMKIDQKKNEMVHNNVRHQNYRTTTSTTTTTTDESLFGDGYQDSDYEDDNEYDDWNDNDDDLDDYEDESVENSNNWQAEEATERQIVAPVSSMTKYKWDNYGTRSRVEESRRQQLYPKAINEVRTTTGAIAHYLKVRQEGQCRTPQPKVIPVQSVHPNPGKVYTPHCTILHRCAEDTGCCSNSDTKCGPKTQVQVHLEFYVKTLGISQTRVERLSFYNHTECDCMGKAHLSSSDVFSPGLSLKTTTYSESTRFCKCPEEFIPKFRYNSRCSCDCDESNKDCIWMKKGNEFFSLRDRQCILDDQCGIPVCEYGVYMMSDGRCPKKHEKLNTFSKMTVQ